MPDTLSTMMGQLMSVEGVVPKDLNKLCIEQSLPYNSPLLFDTKNSLPKRLLFAHFFPLGLLSFSTAQIYGVDTEGER